jgi:two-component system, LytTR family, response regulator
MTSIKAVIVDDERLARVNLKKLLEPYSSIEIVGEADSCESTLALIRLHNPQLIFLDIQLTGESGFDLLETVDSSIKIVFVTAFDEYAIRAFEVNAADYLMKPVNPERLNLTVKRLLANENPEKVKSYKYTDSIYVQLNNSTSKFIKVSDITSIAPVGNYSKIVTTDGKHYLVLKTLKQWQEELPGDFFIRIHRSSIINIEHIDRVEKYSIKQHKVFLKQATEPLEVSRRFAGNLKVLN